MKRVDLAEADLKLKMYESDYEKDEKKLMQKLDERFQEIKEDQRKDKNDIINKLSTFKADISPVTFSQSAYNFLNEKVHKEWNSVSAKGQAHELRLDELV